MKNQKRKIGSVQLVENPEPDLMISPNLSAGSDEIVYIENPIAPAENPDYNFQAPADPEIILPANPDEIIYPEEIYPASPEEVYTPGQNYETPGTAIQTILPTTAAEVDQPVAESKPDFKKILMWGAIVFIGYKLLISKK